MLLENQRAKLSTAACKEQKYHFLFISNSQSATGSKAQKGWETQGNSALHNPSLVTHGIVTRRQIHHPRAFMGVGGSHCITQGQGTNSTSQEASLSPCSSSIWIILIWQKEELLQGRFTWQEGNETTSQCDQYLLCCRNIQEITSRVSKDSNSLCFWGARVSTQPWLPRRTPDVCLGQETLPKSVTPPSWGWGCADSFGQFRGTCVQMWLHHWPS